MEVHVIRHTPVEVNKNQCYGQLDVPLADSFEKDVKAIKKVLNDNYDIVYSSPKKRCTQLASALAFDTIVTDERLLELNFGAWEGKLWHEIDQKALHLWMENFVSIAPIEGESLEEMYARISSFMNALRNKTYEKILIISHAGVIRCVWAYLLEIPLKNIFKIPVGFHEHFVFNLGANRQFDSIIKLI